MQISSGTSKTKELLQVQANFAFVLKVPLRYLRPSVINSVPCDRIPQRAYSVLPPPPPPPQPSPTMLKMKKNRSRIIKMKGRMSATSLNILKERKINTIRALKRQKERKKTAYGRFKTNQWFDVDESSFYSHLNNIIESTETNQHPQYKEKSSSATQEMTPHHDNNRKIRRILETNMGECKRSTY